MAGVPFNAPAFQTGESPSSGIGEFLFNAAMAKRKMALEERGQGTRDYLAQLQGTAEQRRMAHEEEDRRRALGKESLAGTKEYQTAMDQGRPEAASAIAGAYGIKPTDLGPAEPVGAPPQVPGVGPVPAEFMPSAAPPEEGPLQAAPAQPPRADTSVMLGQLVDPWSQTAPPPEFTPESARMQAQRDAAAQAAQLGQQQSAFEPAMAQHQADVARGERERLTELQLPNGQVVRVSGAESRKAAQFQAGQDANEFEAAMAPAAQANPMVAHYLGILGDSIRGGGMQRARAEAELRAFMGMDAKAQEAALKMGNANEQAGLNRAAAEKRARISASRPQPGMVGMPFQQETQVVHELQDFRTRQIGLDKVVPALTDMDKALHAFHGNNPEEQQLAAFQTLKAVLTRTNIAEINQVVGGKALGLGDRVESLFSKWSGNGFGEGQKEKLAAAVQAFAGAVRKSSADNINKTMTERFNPSLERYAPHKDLIDAHRRSFLQEIGVNPDTAPKPKTAGSQLDTTSDVMRLREALKSEKDPARKARIQAALDKLRSQ